VVGHEIGHVIHRDALVVTLLAGPPAYFFAGLRQMVDEDPFRGAIGGLTFLVLLGPLVFVTLLLSRLVCRHRELAADRAAALLTGSPAAVAAALMAVDT
jgi:heat shock protein HtpX